MKRVNENPPARFPVKPLDEYSLPWWVAKVKPRQEKALAFDFIAKNIEYYLPLLTKVTRRKDNNKPRKSIIPLFPGYISFCADKNDLRTAFSTGRVVNTIDFGYWNAYRTLCARYFGRDNGLCSIRPHARPKRNCFPGAEPKQIDIVCWIAWSGCNSRWCKNR